METAYLQSFVAVVESGSIAEAARRLDLAPTTVAQQMRALERELGSKLLQRSGRTVIPTSAGAQIIERCQRLLQDVRDLRSAASDGGLPAGPLRLGSTPTALMGLLPPILKRWNELHPDIAIYFEPGTSSHLLQRVIGGELDAAIIVHPTYDLSKACSWKFLREEKLVLLTSAVMDVADPLKVAATEPYIRYDRRVVAGRMAHDYLSILGITPKVQFELDGIEHIAKLVAEGFGVSVLPDWPVLGEDSPLIRRWPLPEPCPARKIGMVWLRNAVRSPLVTEFLSIAVES